jgi:hypothetical protein
MVTIGLLIGLGITLATAQPVSGTRWAFCVLAISMIFGASEYFLYRIHRFAQQLETRLPNEYLRAVSLGGFDWRWNLIAGSVVGVALALFDLMILFQQKADGHNMKMSAQPTVGLINVG